MSEALQFAGQVLVGLLVLGGVLHTNRTSKAAGEKATGVAARAEAASEWDKLVTQLSSRVAALEPRLEQIEQERNRLASERDADRRALRQLERRLEDYVRRYRAAVRYIVKLQQFIAEHVPSGPDAPTPPADVLFDLDEHEPLRWPPPREQGL